MEIKRAGAGDINNIQELMQESQSGQVVPDTGSLQHFYLAYSKENELVGVAGFQIIGNNALLQALSVKPGFRGKGFGYLLMKTLDHAARTENIENIYLVSNELVDYFKRYGYEPCDTATLPQDIAASDLFQNLAKTSQQLMHLPVLESA
jgi:N-acetylglutamate synthase-like GNAT family acetyltransferase